MKVSLRMVSVGVVAIALGGCASNQDDDHGKEANELTITLDQVPPAVKATMEREAEGNKITEVEKETKKDKVAYEADTSIGGKSYEIKVAEDGTLVAKKLEDEKKDKDENKEKSEKHEKDDDD